jgi:hypothetical protein
MREYRLHPNKDAGRRHCNAHMVRRAGDFRAIFADHAPVGTILMFNLVPQHGESLDECRGEPLYHASLSSTEYERSPGVLRKLH